MWKNEDQERVAVVQSVNSVDRVAVIRCADTGTLETVSVLELDPNGTGDMSPDVLHGHGFGVRRGDSVFVHPEGTTNGFAPPRVPKIGEIEEWVREPPVRADGELGGWRRTMADLGARIAADRKAQRTPLYNVRLPRRDDNSLSWFGEVTEACIKEFGTGLFF
jgi:ubiquitin-conjugating enzyme E2 O